MFGSKPVLSCTNDFDCLCNKTPKNTGITRPKDMRETIINVKTYKA